MLAERAPRLLGGMRPENDIHLPCGSYEHILITVMPRPCCQRRIGCRPDTTYFKPAGVPLCELAEVMLTLDELEALRLADFQGLYQEQAAGKMKISRATFARIVEVARKKVADALIHGKALRIEGGTVTVRTGGCGSQRRGRCCERPNRKAKKSKLKE